MRDILVLLAQLHSTSMRVCFLRVTRQADGAVSGRQVSWRKGEKVLKRECVVLEPICIGQGEGTKGCYNSYKGVTQS
jgi:hypothetical protein